MEIVQSKDSKMHTLDRDLYKQIKLAKKVDETN